MTQEKKKDNEKLWGGRFSKSIDETLWDYSTSVRVDYRLVEYDICASMAHTIMLGKCGHLTSQEQHAIVQGLHGIYTAYTHGALSMDRVLAMNCEDIHSCVEMLLYKDIGDIAGKMHLGRSRNDQIAVDTHCYLRSASLTMLSQLGNLVETLIALSEAHIDTIIPGYTHLQRAEPIRLAHHFMAYVAMCIRDMQRIQDSWKRINTSPLGAGAFSGSPVEIDTALTAELLSFNSVYDNSIDAVSDRDYILESLFSVSLIQLHISKLSEELILWSTKEFAFIEADDAFCTGSSMMPQKKNLDAAELARGKTGSVFASLISLLTMLKGLPLSYNRDLQEDKKPLFEALDTVSHTLVLFAKMLPSIRVNTERTRKEAESDYSNATEIANYLSKKAVPFRDAHRISGEIVQYGIQHNLLLKEISIEVYRSFSPLFEPDIIKVLDVHSIIETHTVPSGTSKNSVLQQISTQKKVVAAIQQWTQQNTDATSVHTIIKNLILKTHE